MRVSPGNFVGPGDMMASGASEQLLNVTGANIKLPRVGG